MKADSANRPSCEAPPGRPARRTGAAFPRRGAPARRATTVCTACTSHGHGWEGKVEVGMMNDEIEGRRCGGKSLAESRLLVFMGSVPSAL
jgi:hypothetical protein